MDGSPISLHAADHLEIGGKFFLSGVYDWEIVERWWDQNLWEKAFYFPQDFINGSVEDAVWQTKEVNLVNGSYYAVCWRRNPFGLSK